MCIKKAPPDFFSASSGPPNYLDPMTHFQRFRKDNFSINQEGDFSFNLALIDEVLKTLLDYCGNFSRLVHCSMIPRIGVRAAGGYT
jgi:hypothetical protein